MSTKLNGNKYSLKVPAFQQIFYPAIRYEAARVIFEEWGTSRAMMPALEAVLQREENGRVLSPEPNTNA